VLDEADRMIYQGFEHAVRSISSMIRPDRQMLLFSATWPYEVRALADEYLKNAGRVYIGADEAHAAQKVHLYSLSPFIFPFSS
jgi:superfamily II DNA/RNA helicase